MRFIIGHAQYFLVVRFVRMDKRGSPREGLLCSYRWLGSACFRVCLLGLGSVMVSALLSRGSVFVTWVRWFGLS